MYMVEQSFVLVHKKRAAVSLQNFTPLACKFVLQNFVPVACNFVPQSVAPVQFCFACAP